MASAEPSTVVIGIDEAGYGPLLGPLVVSSVAFRVPAALAHGDWWKVLRGAIAPRPRARDPRLVVTDSKELSRRHDGLRWLERAALTFLSLPDPQGMARTFPPRFRGLLGQLDRTAVSALAEYPWYREADFPLPAVNTDHDVLTQRTAVNACLRNAGFEFLGAGAEILLEGHFNRLVAGVRNKSVVLLGQTIRLIHRAAQAHGRDGMLIQVDKQGGRQAYGRPLMTAFDDAGLEILEETDGASAYRMTRGPATWEIRFTQGGEKHHFAIALASIFSKYLRELFMYAFNTFWGGQQAGVAPTAGYYTDGLRFVQDIEPAIARLGVDRGLLIRTR